MGAPPAAAAGLLAEAGVLAAAAGVLAAAAGVLGAAAGTLAAVVAAGALVSDAAVFFELEQPAAVSAASTVSATIRFVAAIKIPSLLATATR